MNDASLSEDDKKICNSLGNLVILERDINRNMGGKQVLKAADKDKPEYYQRTKYLVAKDVQRKLCSWDINAIVQRREEQEKVLIELLSRN